MTPAEKDALALLRCGASYAEAADATHCPLSRVLALKPKLLGEPHSIEEAQHKYNIALVQRKGVGDAWKRLRAARAAQLAQENRQGRGA